MDVFSDFIALFATQTFVHVSEIGRNWGMLLCQNWATLCNKGVILRLFTGERIRLRKISNEDVPVYHKW